MAIWLGLDIGTNSVGSAWVDTDKQTIALGVSVFPAGVEERENKRGDPKNKSRRMARSQRRSIARRAKRKRQLRKLVIEAKLLPHDSQQLSAIFSPTTKEEAERWNPWHLRREGLERELSPMNSAVSSSISVSDEERLAWRSIPKTPKREKSSRRSNIWTTNSTAALSASSWLI